MLLSHIKHAVSVNIDNGSSGMWRQASNVISREVNVAYLEVARLLENVRFTATKHAKNLGRMKYTVEYGRSDPARERRGIRAAASRLQWGYHPRRHELCSCPPARVKCTQN